MDLPAVIIRWCVTTFKTGPGNSLGTLVWERLDWSPSKMVQLRSRVVEGACSSRSRSRSGVVVGLL